LLFLLGVRCPNLFFGIRDYLKSLIAPGREPSLIDSLVTVRKQSSMPSHACDPGRQRERFALVALVPQR